MLLIKYFNIYPPEKKEYRTHLWKNNWKDYRHGNVDLLSHRLSNVRTWSYVANKKIGKNSDYWVQLTKNIEDKLSDKLHDELTKSFIDKKISIFQEA